MLTLNSPEVAQETAIRWKRESKLALVPTMGNLHAGHAELIRTAQRYAEKVVVSIFVNPLQFSPGEDLDKYPRTLEQDQILLGTLGVDLLFCPQAKELYPDGFSTRVHIRSLSETLCGQYRPGHFEGVSTVVLKLFNVIQPDFAVFGMKDFQQLRIIQQMVSDLNLPITILAEPTVREPDGLSYSSRNQYLSDQERGWARQIPLACEATLQHCKGDPTCTIKDLTEIAKSKLRATPIEIEYLEVTSSRDLIPVLGSVRVMDIQEPRMFLAARVGRTRLIDNWALGGVL